MTRTELIRALQGLTATELDAVLAAARGSDTHDVKALIERELARPPALNSPDIERLAQGDNA